MDTPKSLLAGIKLKHNEVANFLHNGYTDKTPYDAMLQDRLESLIEHYGRGEVFKALVGSKRRNSELDRHLANIQATPIFGPIKLRDAARCIFSNELKALALAKGAKRPSVSRKVG